VDGDPIVLATPRNRGQRSWVQIPPAPPINIPCLERIIACFEPLGWTNVVIGTLNRSNICLSL
jgi:hypothetical protein